MTSNAGANRIISPKKLGFASASNNEKEDHETMKNGVMEEVKRIFKPEFINRIDEIIVFHSLVKEEIRDIVKIMLNTISNRIKNQMEIELQVSNKVIQYIVDLGYDPNYGARPLRRTLQTEVEDKLAEEILDGTIQKGSVVAIEVKNKRLHFRVKK